MLTSEHTQERQNAALFLCLKLIEQREQRRKCYEILRCERTRGAVPAAECFEMLRHKPIKGTAYQPEQIT